MPNKTKPRIIGCDEDGKAIYAPRPFRAAPTRGSAAFTGYKLYCRRCKTTTLSKVRLRTISQPRMSACTIPPPKGPGVTKAKTWQAPYNGKGDLQHYPSTWWTANPGTGKSDLHSPEWRDPSPFRAVLVYEGYARGRSAAYFMWRHQITGTRYPMFMTDLDEMLRTRTIPVQGVHATWIECKRGSNFGIRVATAAEIEAFREAGSIAA